MQQLKNPPIIEAVLSIELAPVDFDPSKLKEIYPSIQDVFQNPKDIKAAKLEMQNVFSPDGATRITDQGIVGYRFDSLDQAKALQLYQNAYYYSSLGQYKGWENFKEEAQKYWRLYTNIRFNSLPRKLRIRYTNLIKIPLLGGKVDIDEYLRLGPKEPLEKKFLLSQFVCKNTLMDESGKFVIDLILADQKTNDPNHLFVLIDIQVNHSVKEDEVLDPFGEPLEQMRDLKNKIFFDSITNKTVEMY